MAMSGGKEWVDFIARYYGDAEFAKKVDANPTEELRTAGVKIPEGKQVRLMKNSDTTTHYVLPSSPVSSVEELSDVYAGNNSEFCYGGSSEYTGNE